MRLLIVALCGLGAVAHAQVPTASLQLSGGIHSFGTSATPEAAGFAEDVRARALDVTGGAPGFQARFEGFPVSWLGASAQLSFAPMSVQGVVGDQRVGERFALTRGQAEVAVLLRLVTRVGFVFQGGLGWSWLATPFPRHNGSTLEAGAAHYNGGAAVLGAGWYFERFEISGDVGLGLGSSTTRLEREGTPVGGLSTHFRGRFFSGFRFLRVDPLLFTVGVEANGGLVFGRAAAQDLSVQGLLALKVALVPKRVEKVTPVPVDAPTVVRVRVRSPAPLSAGARVELDGLSGEVDANGERVFLTSPGPHAVKVSAMGFRTLEATVNANANAETTSTLELQPLTGPGTVKGVVRSRSSKNPIGEAKVTIGTQSVMTDEAGAFTLSGVGPGAVSVKLGAQGFTAGDEVVQVPPEGTATLEVELEPLGKGSPATVRGLIRAITGEPLKASVVIKGTPHKVTVNAEGRFVVTIPGG